MGQSFQDLSRSLMEVDDQVDMFERMLDVIQHSHPYCDDRESPRLNEDYTNLGIHLSSLREDERDLRSMLEAEWERPDLWGTEMLFSQAEEKTQRRWLQLAKESFQLSVRIVETGSHYLDEINVPLIVRMMEKMGRVWDIYQRLIPEEKKG